MQVRSARKFLTHKIESLAGCEAASKAQATRETLDPRSSLVHKKLCIKKGGQKTASKSPLRGEQHW